MVAPGLKARYVDVYLPSEAAKQEWEDEAKKAGLPLSKFVFAAVEAFRAAKDETPRYEMVKELSEAKEETQKLRSELKMKTMLLEKLEADVYKARYASFQEVEMGEGTRRHDQELINILRRGKSLEGYAILKELGVDPGETEVVKLVNNQLDSLQRFGLVEETASGWKWIK
jgi:vacuolar-type H+-ATPase subunit I/STV1